MNLPNRLSIFRISLIPLCVVFLYMDTIWSQLIALSLFIIAAITDILDGLIARKLSLTTTFGKFIDPLADKILILSMLIMLVWRGQFPPWALIIIIMRELSVDGLRMLSASSGKIIAAGSLGKIKTAIQITTVITLILEPIIFKTNLLSSLFIILTLIFTLWSGIDYFIKNKEVFFEKSAQ